MIRPDPRCLIIAAGMMLVGDGASAGWIEGETARMQALDKITARISTLEVPIGTPVLFGTLSVTVRRCAYHPPEEPPEDAAFLEIVDNGYDVTAPPREVFAGWMFSSSPAVSAMEHPVYDITLLSCKPGPPAS
ncbi:MAG: DUF2155 domain-containing protein [Candidatus Puniceispirillaceae bacterium]